MPQSQSKQLGKEENLIEEIKKDLNWNNTLEFIIKLICAYAGLHFIPRLQKKIPQNIQIKKSHLDPSQLFTKTTGVDIKGQPFALIWGWGIAETIFTLSKKFSLLPKKILKIISICSKL